ncbi:hypothetical protein RIF29_20581 [Crotalaria pallida]|uniref:Secreted protein n=1 Tax=Crotalaria pallida TaxID=3830 RepID=A0AAN9F5W2_CROPI
MLRAKLALESILWNLVLFLLSNSICVVWRDVNASTLPNIFDIRSPALTPLHLLRVVTSLVPVTLGRFINENGPVN